MALHKIMTKKRVKSLLEDELRKVEESDWLTKIDEVAVDFFSEKCSTYFPLGTEIDVLNVAQKVIPIMYRNAKMFARHRIISDDVELAFILVTSRKISVPES